MRGIDSLHAIHKIREKPHLGNISFLSIRMGVHHQPARLMYKSVLLLHGYRLKFRVRLHPLLIDAIQQKFRTVITCFIAEEHIQSDLIPLCLRVLISEAELIHPSLPRQPLIHTGVSTPVMVCHKNTGIPVLLTGTRHLRPGASRAGAGLRRMQMGLIQIGIPLPDFRIVQFYLQSETFTQRSVRFRILLPHGLKKGLNRMPIMHPNLIPFPFIPFVS